MNPAKNAKEIAVPRGRERNARISEQETKTPGERSPKNHHGKDFCGFGPIKLLDKPGDDRWWRVRHGFTRSGNELAPGHHSNQSEIDRNVDRYHRDQTDQDRTRDYPARILYFVSDVTHIVIAKVII